MEKKDYRKRFKHQLIASVAMVGTLDTNSVNSVATEVDFKYAVGMLVTFSDETGIPGTIFSGSGFQINSQEIFPKNFELQRVASTRTGVNNQVPPNQKYLMFKDENGKQIYFPAASSLVDASITDGSNIGGAGYTINIWLLLANPEQQEEKEEEVKK